MFGKKKCMYNLNSDLFQFDQFCDIFNFSLLKLSLLDIINSKTKGVTMRAIFSNPW